MTATQTIELTQEDAKILRELIAERKASKELKEFAKTIPSRCKHGVYFHIFCWNCENEK